MSQNLQGLLERGVQKSMDAEKPKGPVDPSALPLAIETMLGYTGAVCQEQLPHLRIFLYFSPCSTL